MGRPNKNGIQELSKVLSIHRARNTFSTVTGDAWINGRSFERYSVERAVRILLNMRIEKKVRSTMDSSFRARMSPNPSTP